MNKRKSEFKLPPVSPLIGTSLRNFNKVIYGKRIDPPYRFKIFLTRLIIICLSPLRLYNRLILRAKKVTDPGSLNPVFILGHWRSGTTYLHNLLCEDPESAFISTYQTVFPNYLASKGLLKPIMRRVMPSKRPGDSMDLAPENPQEEEFAVSNLTERSFYHFFYFPNHTGDYYHKYVRLNIDSREKQRFKEIYVKILQYAMLGHSSRRRLVLKNPVNTARLEFLTATFPTASYIHMYRNPYIVYLSTKQFFSELFPTLWLQEIDQNQINSLVIDLYLNLYDDYFEFKKRNPEFKVLEVPFEKFESNPLPFLEEFYKLHLTQDFDEIKGNFTSYIKKQKAYKKNKYEISRNEYKTISEKWSKYIDYWGYKIPPDIKIVDDA